MEEFLRLVKANNAFSLPQTILDHGALESEHSRAFGGVERLDMFFPFDPCLLRKCDRLVFALLASCFPYFLLLMRKILFTILFFLLYSFEDIYVQIMSTGQW